MHTWLAFTDTHSLANTQLQQEASGLHLMAAMSSLTIRRGLVYIVSCCFFPPKNIVGAFSPSGS